MSETLKPGTRCQCRACNGCCACGGLCDSTEPCPMSYNGCTRDAVRIIPVPPDLEKLQKQGPWKDGSIGGLAAMCEPCSAWHQAKAGELTLDEVLRNPNSVILDENLWK